MGDDLKAIAAKHAREALVQHMRRDLLAIGAPPWVVEYRFDPGRQWRADIAWPALGVLLEVEGGTWVRGRHVRGAGYRRDCEKYNAAALAGWRVFRVTSDMVEDGSAAELMERVFECKEEGA